MDGQTLQAVLRARLERQPERPVLGWCSAGGECVWRTAGEVRASALAAAQRLRAHGLRAGDACVIVLPSEEAAGTAFLGALFAGAAPLLIAPPTLQRFNSDLLRVLLHALRRTRARVVVHGGTLAEVGGTVRSQARQAAFVAATDLCAAPPVSGCWVEPRAAEVAALQLTSGTTGLPRIAIWSHAAVLAALDGMAVSMRLHDGDVCFNWTPLYHDMGLVNNFLLCLSRGVPLVMLRPQDFVRRPSLWLRGLASTGATLTWSPNFGFAVAAERVREEEIEDVRLEGVRAFWNAAERVHGETMEAFYSRFAGHGVRREALKTNFGCVENVGGATFSDPQGPFVIEHIDRRALQRQRVARPVPPGGGAVAVASVGRPNPGTEVVILSSRGRRLGQGRVGEIALRTPSRMLGYMGDARATRRALSGELLRTGDLGYVRNGELFWVGRVRERITVHGKKLDPSDFEPVLLHVAGVRAGCFAAFGVDDPAQGTERIVIVAEVRHPLPRSSREIRSEIRREVFRRLDVLVSEVLLVAPGSLAKTSSGKRRHSHFRRLYVEGKLQALASEGARERVAV